MTAPRPFHAAPPAPPGRGRMLLISYHFPPTTATGGQRWQKMVRIAYERGLTFDVVTLEPSALAAPQWSLLEQLPPGTRLFGVAPPPAGRHPIAGALRRLLKRSRRRNAGMAAPAAADGAATAPTVLRRPDIRWRLTPGGAKRAFRAWRDFAEEGRWARAATGLGARLLGSGSYDGIVTCGPPHRIHAGGAALARRFGLPLVMDLRDPWSQVPGLPPEMATPLWFALARHHERKSVRAATLVVSNTEPARQALIQEYPALRDRFITIRNGFDDGSAHPPRHTDRFVIAYAGNIYIDRDPRPILRAVARLVESEGLTPDDVGVHFIGHVFEFGGVPTMELARALGVGDVVSCFPRCSRADLFQHLSEAAVLVSLPQGTDLSIPSKIFEYMQFHAWPLVLARAGSATETLLRGSRADVVDPDDEEAIAAVVRRRFHEFSRGIRCTPLVEDARFSRREQAERLFGEIDSRILGSRPPLQAHAQSAD